MVGWAFFFSWLSHTRSLWSLEHTECFLVSAERMIFAVALNIRVCKGGIYSRPDSDLLTIVFSIWCLVFSASITDAASLISS
jgi:hypothetical protein